MSDDTTLATDAELVEVEEFPGLDLGAMLGGLDLGAMFPGMAELLADVNDPDRVTLDDLDDTLAVVLARLDWLAVVVVDLVGKAPAKLRPTLPPWPEG